MSQKAHFIAAIAHESGLTQAQAARALDAVGNVIACYLIAGQTVRVPSVGTLTRKEVAEHTVRNPATGATMVLPKQGKVIFRPSRTLKKLVK